MESSIAKKVINLKGMLLRAAPLVAALTRNYKVRTVANYLRGPTAGIILIIGIAAAAAIYVHELSVVRGGEQATISLRVENMGRYLDVITQNLQRLKSRVESHYGQNPGTSSIPDDGRLGTVYGLKSAEFNDAGPALRRELKTIRGLEELFASLVYDDKTIERAYYKSDRDFLYAVPQIEAGSSELFRGHVPTDSSAYIGPQRGGSAFDIVDMDESRQRITISLPVRVAGTSIGMLGVSIAPATVRALLNNGESVGRSYLSDGRDLVGRDVDFSEEEVLADSNYSGSRALSGGLEIVHRFPHGEPYWAAARSSIWEWLVVVVAAAAVSFTVHKAVRSEVLERRRAERELRDAYGRQKELSSRLRNLAHELTTAQHQERKRIAARLHDDLQQLLVAAQMYLKQQQYEDVGALITEAIDASRDMTQQLRPSALYEAGLVPALRTLSEQIQRRHSLEVNVDAGGSDDEVELHYDLRVLLFEAVRELVFNAVKHAEVGTVTVKVRCSRSNIRIRVEDQGRGVDFDPDAKDLSAKLGFGLFSLRERLRAFEGELTIDSALGQGTTVNLSAPIIPPERVVEGQEPSTDSSDGSGGSRERRGESNVLRIVIADDHTAVRQSLANALDADPRLSIVGQVSDGAEAVQSVEREIPDVVLIDINMPGIGGIEAISRIHRRWPDIAIFGLSVEEGTAVSEAVHEAGGISLLAKSMDLEAMTAEITGRAASAEQSCR